VPSSRSTVKQDPRAENRLALGAKESANPRPDLTPGRGSRCHASLKKSSRQDHVEGMRRRRRAGTPGTAHRRAVASQGPPRLVDAAVPVVGCQHQAERCGGAVPVGVALAAFGLIWRGTTRSGMHD